MNRISSLIANKWPVFLSLLAVALVGTRFQNWLILRGTHDLVHGDLGDSRFVNLLLEHAWKFVSGSTFLKNNYWTAPWNFFPAPNTLLMSEVMGGASWNYSLFRWIGYDPIASYQLWFITSSLINFFAAYTLARVAGFRFSGSIASAWLFAFGLVRGAFIGHPQLVPHYFAVFSIIFGVIAWRSQGLRWKPLFYGLLSGASLGLQFWASFYLVWFTILCVIQAMMLALIVWKAAVLKELQRNIKAVLACGFGFSLVSAKLAMGYLSMQSLVGERQWSDVAGLLPKFRALFLPSPEAWLYRWLFELNFNVSGWYSEMFMFPGFLPLVFVLISLWSVRRKSFGIIQFSAVLWLMMMLSTQHDLWKLIYNVVPGAGAVRAVGRIALAGLIPLGLCVAGVVDKVGEKSGILASKNAVIKLLLVILIFLDNGVTPNFGFSRDENKSRIELVKSSLDGKSCAAFHFAAPDTPWKVEIDAMWTSMELSIPTFNGYSGGYPPGYRDAGLTNGMSISIDDVRKWLRRHELALADDSVCVIKFQPRGK
jgi:hypothetical protein